MGHSESQQKQPLNCIHSAKCFNRTIWRECQESLPKKLLFFSGPVGLDHSGLPCSPNARWHRRSALGEAPWSGKGSGSFLLACARPHPQCLPRAVLQGQHHREYSWYSGKHRELLWTRDWKKKVPTCQKYGKSDLLVPAAAFVFCTWSRRGVNCPSEAGRSREWNRINPAGTAPFGDKAQGDLCSALSVLSLSLCQ